MIAFNLNRTLRRVAMVGWAVVTLAAGQPGAWAATTPAVRVEVESLLTRLQASGCEFNRNGTWYDGAQAKAHLQRKFEYLDDRNAVTSAERFIELGATGSSMSGKPYQVRCGSAAPVSSQQWLLQELKTVRATAARVAPASGH